jgi:hypothetical protein
LFIFYSNGNGKVTLSANAPINNDESIQQPSANHQSSESIPFPTHQSIVHQVNEQYNDAVAGMAVAEKKARKGSKKSAIPAAAPRGRPKKIF